MLLAVGAMRGEKTARPPPRFGLSPHSLPKAASITAMLVGVIATLGGVLSSLVTIKANTAVAFILAGLSLWLLCPEPSAIANRRRRLAQFCALTVVLVGLLTLTEYMFGWDLKIDQLQFQELRGAIGTSSLGRMAPNTAFGLVMVGLALVVLDVETRRAHRPAQFLALMAGLVSLLAFIGYPYASTSFHMISSYTGMVWYASLTMLVLCTGILFARPDRGVMTIVTSKGVAGLVVRRLLPAAVFLPIVVGWLRLAGERAGLYETEFGLGLFALLNVLVFGALIWWTADLVFRVDAERGRAEESRRAIEERFRAVAETANDAIVSADSFGNITYFNKAAESIFGYPAPDVLGKPLTVLIPGRYHDAHGRGLARYLSTGEARVIGKTVELAGKRKDGSEFPLEFSLASWMAGKQTFFTAMIRDITERKLTEEKLARTNEDLTSVNKELEAFTYSVSHDLRAPLRQVDGFSKILLEELAPQLDSNSQHCLRRIQDGVQQMGRLVDDLLNLGRVSRQALVRQRTALKSLVLEVLAELNPETKGREIEWQIGDLPVAECDRGLIKLVFTNLLSNAVKFTRPQEHAVIQVGHMTSEGQMVIFVRDNGIGFNMRYVDKLFGIFQRLHRQEDFEGTGVGLANVQRIVHRHSGRVWAEAVPHKGATFYFTLGFESTGPEINATVRGGACQPMR